MAGPETGLEPKPKEEEHSRAEELYRNFAAQLYKDDFDDARRFLKDKDRSAAVVARRQAESGEPYWTQVYLELSDLSGFQKRELLALAYDSKAERMEEEALKSDDFTRSVLLGNTEVFRRRARILKDQEED